MQRVTAFTENEEIYPFYLFVVVAVFFFNLSFKPGTTINKNRRRIRRGGRPRGLEVVSECSDGPAGASLCGSSAGLAGRVHHLWPSDAGQSESGGESRFARVQKTALDIPVAVEMQRLILLP